MVASKKIFHRLAFTMIELIFAIVIIGIAVLSLPVMIQINSKGIESNIVQEAIFAASSQLMAASSGYWDVVSMNDNSVSHISRVLNIGGDCNSDRLRPGHIEQPLHRRCLDADTVPSNSSDNIYQNLDNAVVTDENLLIDTTTGTSATASAKGYKKLYTSSISINITDNIKKVTSTIKDGGNTVVVLKLLSANIGEIDYYKRRF